jgi:hypothetical protein
MNRNFKTESAHKIPLIPFLVFLVILILLVLLMIRTGRSLNPGNEMLNEQNKNINTII